MPSFLSIFSFLVNPSGGVNIFPTENVVNGGDTVNISCSTSTGPVNTFTWLFNGNEINEGGRYTITGDNKNSKLTISDIMGEDHGTYTCRVVNLAGSTTATSPVTGIIICYNVVLMSYFIL